jgi:hypothetical protein
LKFEQPHTLCHNSRVGSPELQTQQPLVSAISLAVSLMPLETALLARAKELVQGMLQQPIDGIFKADY